MSATVSPDTGTHSLKDILPLLICSYCGSHELAITRCDRQRFKLSFPLGPECILCQSCEMVFPVTSDNIPVMWTPAIKEYLAGQVDESSNLTANIEVYDATSDEYFTAHYTKPPDELKKISEAINRALGPTGNSEGLHLDFGCGPGQMFIWTEDLSLKRVGLDVSLTNLRNTRKYTGALVVCGDACRMPFRDNIFSLTD